MPDPAKVVEALELWKSAVSTLQANPDSTEAKQNEAETFAQFDKLMEAAMNDDR